MGVQLIHEGWKAGLGWQAEVKFCELVRMMVESDLEDLKTHGDQHGYRERS